MAKLRRLGGLVCFGLAGIACAQTAPTVYTVTELSSFVVPNVQIVTYRNGQMAAMDQSYGPREGNLKGFHVRSVINLQTGTSYSWDLINPSGECGVSSFKGGWGDPFVMSKGLMEDVTKSAPKQVGTEIVAGISTAVLEAATPGATAKIWQDTKTGLILRAVMTPASGPAQTLIDVKEVSYAAPPQLAFKLAASCAGKVPPPPMTEAERIASETSGKPGTYVPAWTPPAVKGSTACTVLIRTAHAGSMEPITSGIQMAVDLTVNADHPPAYTFGIGDDGHQTFSGGGIREVTGQLKSGTYRLENAPGYFYVKVVFGKGGEASANIYKQCSGATGELIFVVKNTAQLSEGGDWVWKK
jgi:hypothetical protein